MVRPDGETGQRFFTNPVLPGFHPDPSICRVGEDYYLAVSSFEYFPGVPLFHSRDLVHWRSISHALTRRSQLDLAGRPCSQGIFAPTLRQHAGRFYLITTDVGGTGNFFVTAEDPSGPWSEPVFVDRGCFDPSLFFDDDGRVYYTRRECGVIVQAEIDLGTGRLRHPVRRIAGPFASSDAEGPHLYKINGWYYLVCAEGGTGYGHMVTVGRSRSPWGPFAGCPWNPILTHRHLVPHAIRYTGHGDLVEAFDGSWWMVFLGTRHNPKFGYNFHVMGRETFLAPVEWRDGWPVVNGGNPVELQMRAPSLPPHPWPEPPDREQFRDGSFGPEWTFLRTPPRDGAVCFVPSGGLILQGTAENLDAAGSPAFVGRRQTDHHFCARTQVCFAPDAPGEEAGLTILQSNQFHIEICLRREADGLWLVTRRRLLDLSVETTRKRWPAEEAVLGVRGDYSSYTFLAGTDEGALAVVDRCPLRFLSTELATGWTGVVLGPYATGNGRACVAPATFPWFEYRGNDAL